MVDMVQQMGLWMTLQFQRLDQVSVPLWMFVCCLVALLIFTTVGVLQIDRSQSRGQWVSLGLVFVVGQIFAFYMAGWDPALIWVTASASVAIWMASFSPFASRRWKGRVLCLAILAAALPLLRSQLAMLVFCVLAMWWVGWTLRKVTEKDYEVVEYGPF